MNFDFNFKNQPLLIRSFDSEDEVASNVALYIALDYIEQKS